MIDSTGVVADTPTERVAYVAFMLAEGAEYSTAEVAHKCGISLRGAYALMNKASRVIPIYKEGTRWKRFEY